MTLLFSIDIFEEIALFRHIKKITNTIFGNAGFVQRQTLEKAYFLVLNTKPTMK
jgi:hypothetical protein